MPNTVFIALQCCQCSIMQVKQKKKSSNKWICSVCNQKQSLRKVFAHGDFARDLRKFVQEFNWNQKDQTLTLDHALKEEGEGGEGSEPGFESRIETEMPNKKIKLNNNGGGGSDVSKWNSYITQDDDMEPDTCPKAAAAAASKWDGYITTEEDDEEQRRTTMAKRDSNWSYLKQVDSKADGSTSGGKQRTRQPAVMGKMKSASKWDYYLAQEQDDDQRTRQQQLAVTKQSASKWDYHLAQEEDDDQSSVFQTITEDQPVEDDIHSDFI